MGIIHAKKNEELLEYDQARARAKTYLEKCRPFYITDDVLAGLVRDDPDNPRLNVFEVDVDHLEDGPDAADDTEPTAEDTRAEKAVRIKLQGEYQKYLEAAAFGQRMVVEKYCKGFSMKADAQDAYGRSAIFLAAERGHVSVIKVLLGCKAEMNIGNNDGWSPLHAAAFHGQVACIDALVKEKADVNAKDNNGCSPLMLATSSPKLSLMDLMAKKDRQRLKKIRQAVVQKRQRQEAQDGISNGTEGLSVDSLKHVPPHLLWQHFPNRIDLIVIDRLLKVPRIQIDATDRKKRSPLNYAALYGRTISVSRLLHQQANIHKVDGDGRTALMQACSNDHFETAELLLRAGSSVNTTDQYFRTPLHCAMITNNEHLANLLLESEASVNAYDCEGATPILLAMDCNNRRLFSELIQRRSNLDVVDKRGWNVIIYAIEAGMLQDIAPRLAKAGEKVQRILRARDPQGRNAMHHAVALPNVRAALKAVSIISQMDAQCAIFGDCNGETALHVSAGLGRLEVLHKLVESAPEQRADYENNRKETPLHLAAHGGHMACVLALVENSGKGESACDAGAIDGNGMTLLMHACISGHLDLVNLLLGSRKGVQDKIILPPLDVNHQDDTGATALHIASREGHWQLLASLLLAGASLSAVDRDGFTALHWAAVEDEAIVVSCLMDLSMDPNSTDKSGWTPLMHAACGGSDEVVRVLVDGGADLEKRNFDGDTALQICHRRKDAPELVRLTYDILSDGMLNNIPTTHRVEAKGHLMISVLDAVDLYMEGKLGCLNTYVCLQLHTHHGSTPLVAFTSCIMRNPDPEWHEVLRFDIESLDPTACLVAWVIAACGDSEDDVKKSAQYGLTEEQLEEMHLQELLEGGPKATMKPVEFNRGLKDAFDRLTKKADRNEEIEVGRLRKVAMAQSKGCQPTMDLIKPLNADTIVAARRWNEVANLRALLKRGGCEIQDPLVPRAHYPLGCVLVHFRTLRAAVWDPQPVEISRTLRLNCRGSLRMEMEFRPTYFEVQPERRAVLQTTEEENRTYTVKPLDYTTASASIGMLMASTPYVPEPKKGARRTRRIRPKVIMRQAAQRLNALLD